LVSLDPSDGAILAYVGGRDYLTSSFDRAAQAKRQAGSAFKPVVFAAALAAGANPTDQLMDSPIMVAMGGDSWRPHNDDGAFRGVVSVRESLERSLNIPAVRLALATGTESVAALATRMGFASDIETSPSLALGTVDVSPLELATAYATLAAGGVRHAPHGLTRVVDARGVLLPGTETPAPARALDPDTTFLVTAMLQGVLVRGTGGGVRRAGLTDPLAGKTGTSDEGRDAWFAGYSPERAAVVWVGRDDNSPAKLSGSRHALPIWTHFMRAVRPAGGYPPPLMPEGVVSAEVDPATRYLATPYCPQRSRDFFYASRVPVFQCPLHGGPMLANALPLGTPQLQPAVLTAAAPGANRIVILTGGAAPADNASWIAMPPPPTLVASDRPTP
jgi:penicillin-binding protein 1B